LAERTDVEPALSAVTGDGVSVVVDELARFVDRSRREQAPATRDQEVIHRPVPDAIEVTRVGEHAWEVTGRAAQRAVRFSDLTDEGALDEVVTRLRDLGVDRQLARAGVADGDVVSIGAVTFEWWRDAGGAGLDRGRHRVTHRERLARSGRLGEEGDGD
jgi:Obg family GTPase CgtA-like protein